MRRVVITGIGVVSPVGIGWENMWTRSRRGKSGISPLKRFDPVGFPTKLGAEIEGFDPEKYIKRNPIKSMDITSQYATAAANMAVDDAGLKGCEKVINKAGVVAGTTLGTISFILDQQEILKSGDYRSIHKHTGYMALHNAISSDISIELGTCGFSESISSACVSGLSSIDYGLKKIRYDGYKLIIAGGADSAFRPLPYAGLNVIHILTNDKIRPFDINADGTVLGEGAAFVALEDYEHAKKRKAKIYCEVLDAAFTCESSNHFGHEKEPVQAVRAIRESIKKSGVSEKDIDIVNTHGLGVKLSDVFECKTYLAAFGKKLCGKMLFTSIKPYIGHPLAAASAMQTIYSAIMLKEGVILPTLNFEEAGDSCGINILKEEVTPSKSRHALINSNAFGGKCGSCVLRAMR